jgi:GH25 family lysozyme M1 (1,4-beta-N-acetylmuramidase)
MTIFTPNPVVGIDISRYQYAIDVKSLLDVGVKVFIVKIGQNKYLDPSFYAHATNIAKYASQGAILQCYYWDEITSDPVAQANWVAAEVRKSGLPISFVWLDDEQWWNSWAQYYQSINGTLAYSAVSHPTPANLSAHFKATYDTLKANLGADKCGIYANKSFVDEHATVPAGGIGTSMGTWMGANNVSMWIPYYGYQSNPRIVTTMTWNIWRQQYFPNYTPTIPTGTNYASMKAHQCTGDRCKLPFIWSNVFHALSPLDINILDGAWLASLTGTTPPPTPIPVPENKFVAVYTLNEYPTSAHLPPVIGFLYQHTEVIVYEVVNNYARIQDPVVNGKSIWVYYPYLQKV